MDCIVCQTTITITVALLTHSEIIHLSSADMIYFLPQLTP